MVTYHECYLKIMMVTLTMRLMSLLLLMSQTVLESQTLCLLPLVKAQQVILPTFLEHYNNSFQDGVVVFFWVQLNTGIYFLQQHK